MWSTFTDRSCAGDAGTPRTARKAALLMLLLAGCDARTLDLTLTIDAGACMLTIPAGGSLRYELDGNGADADAGFCSGCLSVDRMLTDAADLEAFLREHAPACRGLHAGASFSARITGWAAAGCPSAGALFCADGPAVTAPSSGRDVAISLPLGCRPQCAAACVATTCGAQGKSCGAIDDGCGHMLQCGPCMAPMQCSPAHTCGPGPGP